MQQKIKSIFLRHRYGQESSGYITQSGTVGCSFSTINESTINVYIGICAINFYTILSKALTLDKLLNFNVAKRLEFHLSILII